MKVFVKRVFFSFFLLNGYLLITSFFLNHFFSEQINAIIAICIFVAIVWVIQTIGSQPELEWASIITLLTLLVVSWFVLKPYGRMIELNSGEWISNISPQEAENYPDASYFSFKDAIVDTENASFYRDKNESRGYSVTPISFNNSEINHSTHCWLINYEEQLQTSDKILNAVIIHNTFKNYKKALNQSPLAKSSNPVLVYLIPSIKEIQVDFLRAALLANGLIVFLIWAGYTKMRFLRSVIFAEQEQF